MWFWPLSTAWLFISVFVFVPWAQRYTGHLWAMVGCALSVGLFQYLLDVALTWGRRTRIRHFIREHEAELQSAA